MINSDFELIDLIIGYQPAAVITAGLRVGLFDALGEEARTTGDLAAELGVDAPTLGALLDTLEALGLATRSVDGFGTTPFVTRRLARGGELGSVVEKEAFFARAWQELEMVVRTGHPVVETWRERLSHEPETARSFLVALDALARVSGPPLAELSELAPDRGVVDVGGGLGSYTRRLVEAGSEVVLVDLPPVIPWAKETLADLGDAVRFIGADVFEHPSVGVEPESMDAALVSHVLHDLNESRSVDLLGRTRAAIRPGGHVVVNDFAGDLGPGPFGPLFNLMMRVETGGTAHRLERLKEMLQTVGFINVRRAPYQDPLVVLIGDAG